MAAFGLVSPVVIIFALIGAVVASGARNRFTMMIGSGDMEGARGIYTLSLILGVGVSALVMAVVFVFADPICIGLGASGSAAGLLGQARGYLLGLALGLPAMNASRVMQNYMAIDNDRQLTVISSLVLTLVDIVLDVLIAASGGSPFGMGLATSLSHYAALSVLLTHLRRKERLIRFSLKDVRLKEAGAIIGTGLPNGVGRLANTARSIFLNQILAATAAAGCIAAYSVQTMDEVLRVSQSVMDFCKRRGVNGRTAYMSGLCLEEMAGNIVAHGFVKDRKKHRIDIRVVDTKEDLLLRIRDDCVPFDPKERNDLTESGDCFRNMGIKMVYKAARDVEYQSVLGLNVLTIRI